MTPETIINLQNQINSLEESINDVKKLATLLKLHDQSRLESNTKITPGIASKIAYDEKGLILKGMPLEKADIPSISIDQVEGLRNLISTKADIEEVHKSIESIETLSKSNEVYDTGCKINFDKNGFVVSSAPLSIDDIPYIPMDHIEGLLDKLQSIENIKSTNNTDISTKKQKVEPGTYTKVSVDSDGTIRSGNRLIMNDLPMEIISRISLLESKIPLLATKDVVNGLSADINSKLNLSIPDITPGTYTKVRVNKNGMITKGDKLSIRDLPEITINDVTNLSSTLKSKADQNDLIKLNESVNSIVAMSANLSKLNTIQNAIDSKTNDSEFKTLVNRVNELQKKVDTLTNLLSADSVIMQFASIQNDIDTLNGKISSIEHKLNVSKEFDE